MNERKKSGHGTAINKMMNNESMIRVLVYAKKERKKRTREKKATTVGTAGVEAQKVGHRFPNSHRPFGIAWLEDTVRPVLA